MKTILIIFFALYSAITFSQSRIGYSELYIRNEYSDQEYNVSKAKSDDGIYYLSLTTKYALVIHYLNDYNIVYQSLICPHTKENVHLFVEMYNKEYVILSNTSWRVYGENGATYLITMLYLDDYGYVFMWKQE